MSHSISLCKDKNLKHFISNCFPTIEEGIYALNDQGEIDCYQDELSITYNCAPMYNLAFKRCKIPLPETFGVFLNHSKCSDIVPSLELIYQDLTLNPHIYKPLEPQNGYGSYLGLCLKIRALIVACQNHPNAYIYDWY